jgi:hypothetical protein
MSSNGNKLSFKEALGDVMSDFKVAALADPEALTYSRRKEITTAYRLPDEDAFGDFANGTFNVFMDRAEQYLKRNARQIDNADELLTLYKKFVVAQLGIGVVALFSEIAPLVYMRDAPDSPLTPESAAEVTRNSYGFIDKILKSGSRVGAYIAVSYVRPDIVEGRGWLFEGSIINGSLLHPERLGGFGLEDSDGQGPRVTPTGLEPATRKWQEEIETNRIYNPVNCPAALYHDTDTSLNYAEELFGVMVDHAEVHIYPEYLPMARDVINAEVASGRSAIYIPSWPKR